MNCSDHCCHDCKGDKTCELIGHCNLARPKKMACTHCDGRAACIKFEKKEKK